MHAGEVRTHVALVAGLIAEQFPAWAGLPIEPVASSGTENAMYRLGDDLAVRLPRIEGAAGAVAREQQWLPRLAPHLPVAIPEPLGLGRPGPGFPWPWSVYRWLDGANPDVDQLAFPEPDHALALATDLAGFITALQRIDSTGAPRSGRGEPLTRRDRATRAAITDLTNVARASTSTEAGAGTAAAGLDAEFDHAAVTSAWQEALEAESWTGPPVWLHADLSPGNVLLTEGRLSAVIDFAGVGIGDPACDLIIAWNLLPARVRQRLRDALEVDDATWRRGRGWALSIALIQLPYYRTTNPVLAANARHVIAEVLADHRVTGGPGRPAQPAPQDRH